MALQPSLKSSQKKLRAEALPEDPQFMAANPQADGTWKRRPAD
jgi:hypothetical protein